MQITKIEWSDSYTLDNGILDDEHKRVINILNDLLDDADADNSSEIINETLYKLLEHIETHFKHEEEIMSQCNYPRLEQQKKSHQKFHKEVVMFCKSVMTDEKKVVKSLIMLLMKWVTHHISVEDLDIKKYLHKEQH